MSSARKEGEPVSGAPLNWRQRKKAIARRQQLAEEAMASRQQLIEGYIAALGGSARTNPIVMTDIERCVDMVMLARTARAELAAGKTTINDVVKLENAADRAQRRLNLPTPGSAAQVQTLHDYLANRQAASDDGAEE